MKRIAIAVLVLAGIAGLANAQIDGSEHDLANVYGWNEICAYCHYPHGASAVFEAPLWNHSYVSTAGRFTVYTSNTLNATGLDPGIGASTLCMSCHDGTIGVGVLLNAPYNSGTGTTTDTMSSTLDGFVGTDLTDDHPVGFTYNTALATEDGGLFDPSSVAAVAALLRVEKVECQSCHDPHDTTYGPFLTMDNADSALCTTCHNK